MRRFWVIAFCTLGLIGLVTATVAAAVSITALDRALMVRAAGSELARPAVQNHLSNEMAVAVLRNMPAAGRTEAATTAIRDSARATVADPQFAELWKQASGQAFDIVVDGRKRSIVLDPEITTNLVRTHLAETNPQIVALLPPSAQLQVELTGRALPDLSDAAQATRLAPYIAAGAALVSYAIAFGISRQRRRTVRGAGWWLFGVGTLLLTLALLAPTVILPRLFSGATDPSTVVKTLGWRVWLPFAVLTGLGFLVAVLGVMLSKRAPENRITRTTQPAPAAVSGAPTVELWDCRV